MRPGYAPARVHLANAHAQLNRPAEAAALYRETLDDEAASAAAHFGLGRIDLRNGDFAGAARHFEEVLERQPQATRVHYPLARAYQGMGRQNEAEAHLDRRAARGAEPTMTDPMLAQLHQQASGVRIHIRRGEQAVRAGQLEKARAAYRQAVDMDPDNAEARYNLAVALVRTGHADKATRHLAAAARLEPGSARNVLALAWNLDQLGRDEDAVSHYRAAIDRGKDDASVHRLLGDALMRLDRTQEALGHYRRARELAPDEPMPAFREAIALVRSGRYDEARERLDAAARAHPDLATIRNGLARVLAAGPAGTRDPTRALEIGQGLSREHRTVPYAHTFAMALAASGRFEQAVNAQRSIIDRARRTGEADTLPFLEANLERFVAGQPADRPWPDDADVFCPDTMTLNRKPRDDSS
ncbi:MAG: tetratricopeptide repeat protein [Halofilum sp. (in: g-proteobacteria)]|nr:tetratricopeptide repeat protein [Halofilum sp. (in: g-proteobacteria)]